MKLNVGIPIAVHWTVPAMGGSLALFPLMVMKNVQGLFGVFYMSFFIVLLVLVHELGHAAAAIAVRSKVLGLVLSMKGGMCVVAPMPETKFGQLLFILGGIGAQVLVFVLSALYLSLIGPPTAYWSICAAIVFLGVNPLFAIMNLYPFEGSDGQQLLDAIRGKVRTD